MNELVSKTEEVNVLIDAVVECIESKSVEISAIELLTEDVNVYKLCVACNIELVLTTINDADALNEDADITKLPLSVSNKFNLDVWVLFVLSAVDAELCKAVIDVSVEDVYELKLFLILPLAISKLDILTLDADVTFDTDELNAVLFEPIDELKFAVVTATLPLNELIEPLNEDVAAFIDALIELVKLLNPVVLTKVTPWEALIKLVPITVIVPPLTIKLPVITVEPDTFREPLKEAGPMFTKVFEPLTINEPVMITLPFIACWPTQLLLPLDDNIAPPAFTTAPLESVKIKLEPENAADTTWAPVKPLVPAVDTVNCGELFTNVTDILSGYIFWQFYLSF